MRESIQSWIDDTFFCCVLYGVYAEDSASIVSLNAALQQVGATARLFVFDNSEAAHDPPAFSHIEIDYRFNGANEGISKAYNAAFLRARAKGMKWLMTLDQDTELSADCLEQYFDGINQYVGECCFVPQLFDKRGILSPFRVLGGNGFRKKSVKVGVQNLQVLGFVNSGILISTEAFEACGGYDEDFRLDMSDFAFAERLKRVHPSFVCLDMRWSHDFAANSLDNAATSLKRYRTYVGAARLFRKKYAPGNFLIDLRALARGVLLSLRFTSLRFVATFFSTKP